jgi:hypothetical protein
LALINYKYVRPEIAIHHIVNAYQIFTLCLILFAIHIPFTESVYAQDTGLSDIIILGDETVPITGEQTLLEGFVTNETGESSLQGATIFIEELNRGATSDQNGYYRISLAQGEYTLIARYIGMQTRSIRIRIHSADTLRITLADQELDLEEIIVEGTVSGSILRRPIPGLTTSTITDLEQLPQLMGEIDVVQSLVSLPGIQTVGEGASGFNVRGGREDQNLILMDGAPLFNPSHILGLFSVFNPDATENFSLFKGHMPEQFGGRLSSVLDVRMKRGSFEEYSLQGGVGLYSGRIMVEGPVIEGKTSFLLSGRGAASGIIFALAGKNRELMSISLPSDVYNSRAEFYDSNLKLSHRLNSSNTIDLSFYASSDLFRFSDEFGYSWRNRIANLTWRSIITDNLISEVSIAANSYSSNNFTPSGPENFNLRTGIGFTRMNSNSIFTGFKNQVIRFGGEWSRYTGHDQKLKPYTDESLRIEERLPGNRGEEFSLYAGNEIELSSLITLSIGGRYTLYNQKGPATVYEYMENQPVSMETVLDSTEYSSGDNIVTYRGFEPRISASFSAGNNQSIKLSYNKSRQYIHQISNNTTSTPADLWQVSTPYIPPQLADSYTLGYYLQIADNKWDSSVEIYYRDIQNLVEYRDFAEFFMNPQLETAIISAKGRSHGIETSVQKNKGQWTGRISYSYSRVFARTGNNNPETTINSGDWYPADYDQPHNLFLSAVRQLGEKSAFSFNFTWRSGSPITSLQSIYIDSDTVVPIFSERNQSRVPDYIRLDASFTIADNIWKNRKPNTNKRRTDSLNITLYNVLGRANAFSVFYQRPAEAVVPGAYRLSVLGAVIPSITYNFSY